MAELTAGLAKIGTGLAAVAIFIALLLINAVTPWLQKLGFGRLPGDIRFKIFGREIFIPLASTIILSLVCAGISKVL